LTGDAPNEALRGENVQAVFDVLEVKRAELPEMTPDFLEEVGDFESEEELRGAVRDSLRRQLEYDQRRRVRQQITAALTEAADWDLPRDLLQRQSRRELDRAVLELRRSGFSEREIRARENELRQNSREVTARALKEHFILERIAEEEGIDVDEDDYAAEIELIARQSGETPRRVRSRLDKGGHMDVLRNQIVERKVIDLICQHATFTEVPYQMEEIEAEAVDQAAGGGEHRAEIPEAKYDEGPQPLREPEDHT
jgi:trigger factor